jgi:Two component regulator propeller
LKIPPTPGICNPAATCEPDPNDGKSFEISGPHQSTPGACMPFLGHCRNRGIRARAREAGIAEMNSWKLRCLIEVNGAANESLAFILSVLRLDTRREAQLEDGHDCPGCCAGGSQSFFALNPSLDISQYAHTSWTQRRGFSAGNIFAIAKTTDGYLWLGGDFGLFRFDGVNAVPWQPPGHPSDKFVFRLLGARDGTLWIGGLRVFSPGMAPR